MDFTAITVELLKRLSDLTGSWGLAIIVLTVAMRAVLWPLGISQQRSMKKNQELAPKIKEIQTRYKSDPEKMQRKMMEFYKEHKFNPLAGCLPLLIQMPVFILLYSALSCPQFVQLGGQSPFLFIKRLDAPIRTYSEPKNKEDLGVTKFDKFTADAHVKVTFKDNTVSVVKLKKPNKSLEMQKKEITPGKPIDFKIDAYNLDLSFGEIDNIKKAELTLINSSTKAIKEIEFSKKGQYLLSQVNTEPVTKTFHYDILILILLYAATMVATQKVMTASTSGMELDPAQKAMQEQMGNMMPIMLTFMFIFVIPVPAGAMIYLIVSNVFQVIQTVVINKQLELEDKNKTVIDVKPIEVKTDK